MNGRPVTVERREGAGPALARNAGAARSAAEVLLFTDDDTIPDPGWVAAATRFLDEHPDHVGVEGPTISPDFDRLTQHSVHNPEPGGLLTCNIAYRRSAFEQLGGFSDVFPYAHGEDLDLGFRAERLGTVGFAPDMRIVHPPRAIRLRDAIRRGRYVASDVTLIRRNPDRYPSTARRLGPRLYVLYLVLTDVVYSAVRDTYSVGRDPRRAARFAALMAGRSAYAFVAVLAHRAR